MRSVDMTGGMTAVTSVELDGFGAIRRVPARHRRLPPHEQHAGRRRHQRWVSPWALRAVLRTSMVSCRCAQQQAQAWLVRLVRLQCAQLLSAHTEALTASIRTRRANEQVRAALQRRMECLHALPHVQRIRCLVWQLATLSVVVAGCVLPVACCLLHLVCQCMLHVACCMLSAACCMLVHVASCLLHVVCCMLYVSACCMLSAACCLLYAVRCMVSAACCLLHVVWVAGLEAVARQPEQRRAA